MVPCADMPSLPTPAGWMESVRSYYSIGCGLPRIRGGSAPALFFSRPAQRSLTLRPACSPSRFNDLLHQRLQRSRCLHRCSDCYRVERTSSRAGLTPAVDHHLFTAHTVTSFYKGECQEKNFPGDWKERKCSLCVPAHVMLRDSVAFLFFQIHLVIVTALS